jgi:hypothetical protein
MNDHKGDLSHDEEKVHIVQDNSPAGHLRHLLNIGWAPDAPLIKKYVRDYDLYEELEVWIQINERLSRS